MPDRPPVPTRPADRAELPCGACGCLVGRRCEPACHGCQGGAWGRSDLIYDPRNDTATIAVCSCMCRLLDRRP